MKDRVEGHQGIYKDSDTGVIVNRSNTERERYRISKEQAIKNLKSQDEIENLKNELDEIKHLLGQLVRRQNGS